MKAVEKGPLLTDLYQLTMAQAYLRQGMAGRAVFEFFVRALPGERNFLVAAGLEQVLEFLEDLCFSRDEISFLEGTGRFTRDFLEYLGAFRFTGEVHAMPEGTIFFPNEPVLQVRAPLPEAQLVETRIINILHYQVLVASKAARVRLAAEPRPAVDFGLRRAHGAEAGLFAARASYMAGLAGTSTVLAGRLFGIPVYGTMAHSFVQAHDSELEAFLAFGRSQPENVVLLVDTYDVEKGAANAARAARILAGEGIEVKAVRIDSGNLEALCRRVRSILDSFGLHDVKIFASGNLDEYLIHDLVQKDVPVDGFGVGTRLDTSSDAPYLDCAYKLQEYMGRPRMKTSPGKATLPGPKQVYRRFKEDGTMDSDVLALAGEKAPGDATPLLEPVFKDGKPLRPRPSLEDMRARCLGGLRALPPGLRTLSAGSLRHGLEISPGLSQLLERLGHGR